MGWFRRKGGRGGDVRTGDVAVRRALLAVLDRDLQGAEELLGRAVRMDSQDTEAWLALASVYRQRGEVGRAIHVHQNLLLREELDTAQRRHVLTELAADFRTGGFLRRAIASYEEVLSQDRNNRASLVALARLYRDVQDFSLAIDAERRLARIDGSDASAVEAELWVDVAGAARAAGKLSEARRALKRAAKRNPRSIRAWVALGDVEAERGKPRAGLAAWRRVAELDRRAGGGVYPRLAALSGEQGKAAEYESWLRSLVASDGADPGARLALARALASRGAADEAVTEVRRLLEGAGDNLEGHGTLGRVLLAEHRDLDAVKAYAELLEVMERAGLLRPRESSR